MDEAITKLIDDGDFKELEKVIEKIPNTTEGASYAHLALRMLDRALTQKKKRPITKAEKVVALMMKHGKMASFNPLCNLLVQESDGLYSYNFPWSLFDFLLKLEGDLGSCNPQGVWEQLIYGSYRDKPMKSEFLGSLLDYGINVNATNDAGETVINRESLADAETINTLISWGLDPNIPDKEGNTPLIKYTLRLRLREVGVLLQNGADPKIKNNFGFSPEAMIESILQHLADYACLKFTNSDAKFIDDYNFRYSLGANRYIADKVMEKCQKAYRRYQNATPLPLFVTSETYDSHRAKITLDHLFQEINYKPSKILKRDIPIYEIERTFRYHCLVLPIGIYNDLLLPVITYRSSISKSYFRDIAVDPETTRHLYYYFEPESIYYLGTGKTLVTRNKIHAYYLLLSEKNGEATIDDLLKKYLSKLYQSNLYPRPPSMKKLLDNLSEPEHQYPGSRDSSWLRPSAINILQTCDEFDEPIGKLAVELGYDCIVLLQQFESFTSVGTEILDVRTRVDSIRSISVVNQRGRPKKPQTDLLSP